MTAAPEDPEQLYDETASRWERNEPTSLSDYTGRPAVFDMCGDVDGVSLLDLGAGEGYCARELAKRGADRVLALELSGEMVEIGRATEAKDPLGIEYRQADLAAGFELVENFDLAIAVFLFNYTTTEQMTQIMADTRRALRPGGRFVFSVPHPCFAFMSDVPHPFDFNIAEVGYFTGIDERAPGQIYRRDGVRLDVQLVHRTVESYFRALSAAGFTQMPVVRELGVLPEHLEIDRTFFGPVWDVPLHLAFALDV